MIHPKAQPFYLEGSNHKAILFLHGFTASPSELLPTAKIINEKTGCTVSAPLLPGHGLYAKQLNKTTWNHWYSAVNHELSFLYEKYEEIYVAGLSMGGLLALYLAANNKQVKKVITINAPFINNYPILTQLAPIILFIKPYIPKAIGEDVLKLQKEGRFAYKETPVKAFISMMKLRNKTVKVLPNIKIPILAVQSLQDKSVNPRSIELIAKKATNAPVKILRLKNSGHIATMGEEKELLSDYIVKFITS